MHGATEVALPVLFAKGCTVSLPTLMEAPEVFLTSKVVGTFGATSSRPGPSATYRPEPMPGFGASAEALGAGMRLPAAPKAPAGGILTLCYPRIVIWEFAFANICGRTVFTRIRQPFNKAHNAPDDTPEHVRAQSIRGSASIV